MKIQAFFRTIKGRIIALSVGVTLLIATIIVVVSYVVFQSYSLRNQIQSAEFNLQIVANQVSTDMAEITNLTNWCRSNMSMISYLETFRDKQPLPIASRSDKSLRRTALTAYDRLKEEYYSTRSSSYVSRIIVSSVSGENYLQVLTTSDDGLTRRIDYLASTELFQQLLTGPYLGQRGFIVDPLYYTKNTTMVFPIVQPIKGNFSTDMIGWIYLSVSSDLITDSIRTYPLYDDSQLYLTIGDSFYRIENAKLIQCQPDYALVKDNLKGSIDPGTKVQRVRMDNGITHILVTRSLGVDGWYIHQILSKQQINNQNQFFGMLVVVIFAVILSLGLVLAYTLTRTINIPVAQVQRKINKISQGDFSRETTIEWDHEIGDIGKGINHLSQNIVTLMEKRIDDEKQKKDLEYQILQNQINPHFLYNTLSSIKWMASIQGASGIAEMVTALARLLKNVSKGTSTLITLKEELNLVKDYFLIQQYRYGGSITIEYQVESEKLYQCKVHRFSLQPIIENALFHGIEPKGAAGHILVDIHTLDKDGQVTLEISITDDGVGMTEEAIEKVLLNDDNPGAKTDFFRHVGISNVNQRIQYEFGPKYGITIESELGKYTIMKLLLPCVIEEGNTKNV